MRNTKIFAAGLWFSILAGFTYWFLSLGMAFGEFILHIRDLISMYVVEWGIWGGLAYILIYTIRPIIFFPSNSFNNT